MSSILVVGSLAYDSIETPLGRVDRALGGSANYFSLAASQFSQVRVVGVVGEDYKEDDYAKLRSRQVDLDGLVKVAGKTFHWEGKYEGDMNEAQTLKTELNVFENFDPQLPQHYQDSKYVFLANIDPELQMKVMEQVKAPIAIGCDTMNFWIESKLDQLKKVFSKIDMLLINEGEAQLLTGESNTATAAQKVSALGPKYVVVKRGGFGVMLYFDQQYFMLPAFPVSNVVDPTGAGDTFAGGFFGYLSSQNRPLSFDDCKKACLYGTLYASETIQGFGVERLEKVNSDLIEKKYKQFIKMISF